jgi:hypothetical protein
VIAVWPNGDPRDVARAIVAQPRFRGTTAPAASGPTLLERLLLWIGDRLHGLFHGIDRLLGAANPLGGVLAIGLTLAIAIGVVLLIVRFVRLRGRAHRAPREAGTSIERVLTSAELLALAQRLARAERWHEAASALVRAALLALDESGRLRFDPSRTAGEARRLLRDPGFDIFEREATAALFAAGAATPERFARLSEAYAQTFGVAA